MKTRLVPLLSLLLCAALLLPACSGGGAGGDTQPDTLPGTSTDPAPGTIPDTNAGTEPDTRPEPETLPPDLADVELTFGSPVVYLTPGESAAVGGNIAEDKYANLSTEPLWATGDNVFTVENGQITAVGGGCALLRAANPYTGREASMIVRVIDPAHDETCIIGAPIWSYTFMNETQMKYLAEAGFNAVFMSHAPDDAIISFLEMAQPYGITVYPYLATPTTSELEMSDKVIKRRADTFGKYPAFGGFNLRDEPSANFDDYARIAQFIYDLDPSLSAMINFLPDASRRTLFNYASRLHDDCFGGVLSFDNYIFGPAAGSVSETWLFRNFELYRQAGIANRCRTAFYLQSIGSGKYGYRRPDEGTMFYHAMVSLAYGCTMMRYFSYVTPNLEEYTTGVIDMDGSPTDLYPVTQALNRRYAAFGLWLVHATADEVYHTGAKLDGGADYRLLPEGYYITPADESEAKKRTILTTFTDRYTGQNYLMVVNKNFSSDVTVTFALDGVSSLLEVDPGTGLPAPVDVSDGRLTLTLTRGNARLFLLPADKTFTALKTPALNLFEDAYITVSSVSDSAGSGSMYLNDGQPLSTPEAYGWRAAQKEEGAWIFADLGVEKTFNRLDLCPAGNGAACGRFFPASVELQTSPDGQTWTTRVTLSKPETPGVCPSVTFDPLTARYVRLFFPTLSMIGSSFGCELAEICLFMDDGTLPPPVKTDYEPLVVPPDTNVALGKSCCDYSSVQNTWEWHEHESYLTDGDTSRDKDYAFSSGICRNGAPNAHEYLVLDLENVYPIDRVALYPLPDGSGFPRSYTVEVSADGVHWTVVHEVKRGQSSDGSPVFISFPTEYAAFVKVDATLLTQEANPAAGYVLQLCELEVMTPAS